MGALASRDVVLQKIMALREGSESRESVAAWAVAIVDDDAVEISEMRVWKVIKRLGGADLLGSEDAYLYGDEDFSDWEAALLQ
jgi:hypothetical protein